MRVILDEKEEVSRIGVVLMFNSVGDDDNDGVVYGGMGEGVGGADGSVEVWFGKGG